MLFECCIEYDELAFHCIVYCDCIVKKRGLWYMIYDIRYSSQEYCTYLHPCEVQKQSGRKDKQSVWGTHTLGSSFSKSCLEMLVFPKLNTFGMTMSGRASFGAAKRMWCFVFLCWWECDARDEDADGWNAEVIAIRSDARRNKIILIFFMFTICVCRGDYTSRISVSYGVMNDLTRERCISFFYWLFSLLLK